MTQRTEPRHYERLFIGIAGMIGAGKSTLARLLGEHLGIDVYYEPVEDNEYLADFYRDTARYSFATQIYLLNRRFQQHQEIIWRGRTPGKRMLGLQVIESRGNPLRVEAIFARNLVCLGLLDQQAA